MANFGGLSTDLSQTAIEFDGAPEKYEQENTIMVVTCTKCRAWYSMDMEKALDYINSIAASLEEADLRSVSDIETLNIACIAALILKGAISRKKSCGSHYRTDSE